MLRPRWLGLLVVLVGIVVSFTLLGLWQLSVARDDAAKQAVADAPREPVVDLKALLAPHSGFPAVASNRRVSAVGHYDPSGQVLVPDRRLDGATGSWVVTPLVVDETGARLPVVRGFVTTTTAPAPTTAGQVTVVGSAAPGESPDPTTPSLPAGQLGSVDLGRLVNLWPGDIYNAFVFAISETPDASAAVAAGGSASVGSIERIPPPPAPSGLTLRNAAYALQWWVFALFAVYMYVRMVREDHQQRLAERAAHDPAPAPIPATTAGATRP
ncbi:MAG: SURF1 family protein [Actinomycetota bacterium]|nr:SURF1 family protein [Actinomycetota bacterium]